MKKIKCFERKLYASVLVVLLIVVSLSSTSSLTLRFGDDPDTGDQDSHFGVMITNQSGDDYFLYGHNATTEDLYLYANNVDTYPFINLEGNNFIKLYTTNDIYMYEGTANMFLFRLSPPLSTMFGGDATGDDLQIRANSFDSTHSYINLTAGGDVDIDSYADLYFKEQGVQMVKFALSGTDSSIYGGGDADDNLFLRSNSVDGTNAQCGIKLQGASDLIINVPNTKSLKMQENEGYYFFKAEGDVKNAKWYGGHATGDQITIYSNAADATPYIDMNGLDDIYLNATGDKTVTVNDLLLITPRAAAPTSPEQGMIYCSSVNGTMFGYDGSGWNAFW